MFALSSIKKNFILFFFNNVNWLSYNIFNKFYKITKCKLVNTNQTIFKFDNLGFSKSQTVEDIDIDDIKSLLDNTKKNHDNYVTNFFLTDDLKKKIKNLFFKYFVDDIKNFENYYQSKIIVSNVMVWQNHGYDQEKNKHNQFFSEKYHTDNYLFTYFKLFVNLEDVKLSKGPLHFIDKKNTSTFLKLSGYKDRNLYDEKKVDQLVFKNTGSKGESLFFNSTQCLHRAGIPVKGDSRLMLGFIFNAIPGKPDGDYFFYETNDNSIFNSDFWSKYFGKPTGIINLIKLFINFFIK